MIHQIRVIFGDTDQMGVVYYGNYMRYFESARADYWRSLGKTYKDIVEAGVGLPVVEAHCNYRRSAHYEDVLDVDVAITELKQASMRFTYTIRRDGVVIAEGYTRHAVVRTDGRPVALPEALRAAIPPIGA